MVQPIADLWDDFNDGVIDTTKWTLSSGSWSESTGQLCATVPGSASIDSTSAWALEQSSAFVEIASYLNGAGASAGKTHFELYSSATPTSDVYIEVDASAGTIKFARQSGGVDVDTTSITYNATTMRWWRIRENGSLIYFETSPDSAVWTTRFTTATQSWVSSVKVFLFESQTGGTTTAKCFDNFNIASVSSRIVAVGSEFTVSSDGKLGTNRCDKADAAWPFSCSVSAYNALRRSEDPCGLWVQPPAIQKIQIESTSVSVSEGDELSIITIELTNPDTCRGMLFYIPAVARMTIFSQKSDTVAVDAWTLGVQVSGVDNPDTGFSPLQADDIGAGYLTVNYIWCGSADYFWTAGPGETTTIEMKVKAFGSGANKVTKFQAELGVFGMSVVAA